MPWNELIDDRTLFPLSSSEWQKMNDFYQSSSEYPPLRLFVLPDTESRNEILEDDEASPTEPAINLHKFRLDGPEVCQACYEQIRQSRCGRVESRILIRQVTGPEAAFALDTSMDTSVPEQVSYNEYIYT